MQILLVAPYGGVPGGISRWTGHIMDYYHNLTKKDCELDLVPMGRSMFVNINMPVWKRLWTAWIDYRKIFKNFNRKISNNEYDIMHLTSSGSLSLYKDLYMVNRAKKKGLKTIVHFRFGRIPELIERNNSEWKLVRRVISSVDKVIVIDKTTYDALVDLEYTNIGLLPNPVAPKVESIVSDIQNVQREKGEILFTGHVVKTKGIFELLNACSSISGIHLKMVGHITPEMQTEIENIYGVEHPWFSICGEIPYEEVIKEMMRCDIFVLPTYTEGFPNVILEAMSAGCSIIATTVGAIPQMLEEEGGRRYGMLIEPKNVDALYNAITSLFDNEALKAEMRHNVQERVKERYNIQSVWNQMTSIWHEIISI